MIFIGRTYMGEADRVPGVFYVKTEFMHICFFPLVFGDSYLIRQGSEGRGRFEGWKIRRSVSSVLMAYLRASLLVGGFLLPGLLVRYFASHEGGAKEPVLGTFLSILLCLFTLSCIVVFFLTFRWAKATPARALELARIAGIDPVEVAKRFVSADEVDGFLRSHQQSIADH